MSKNSKRINATVGVLTTLAMGASMMAGPMAALASGQADQGAEPQSAPEAKGSAAVHSGLVKTAAIGTFSFDQTYVSPTADVARLQGVAQVACGANASSQVRSADWQLTVSGDVDNAFCTTIGELVQDESTPQLMTCSCGGNPAGGRAIVNAEVGGISIESLLVASQAQKGVNTVTFIADDGTQVSVPLVARSTAKTLQTPWAAQTSCGWPRPLQTTSSRMSWRLSSRLRTKFLLPPLLRIRQARMWACSPAPRRNGEFGRKGGGQ